MRPKNVTVLILPFSALSHWKNKGTFFFPPHPASRPAPSRLFSITHFNGVSAGAADNGGSNGRSHDAFILLGVGDRVHSGKR